MFFNKKIDTNRSKLEKALGLGLISEEEFLRLKCNRADRKLKKFLAKDKKK